MVLEQLFHSLSQRKRPEDVAELIRTLLGEKLSAPEKKALDKAAKGALRRNLWGYTSMSQVFAKPVGALKQITKTAELFQVAPLPDQLAGEVTEIAGFIADTSGLIGKTYAQSNFLKDRLNKQQRKEFGLDLSKRQYNKRFRMLKRLEKKLYTFKREGRKAEFAQIAKHGLAHQITWEEFSRDENTACFIAYYTARCNLRSEFTISGQQRPYDEIAHMLFRRCAGTLKTGLWDGLLTQKTESPTAHWWAIAQVYPHTQVLAHLTDEQKGLLLGRWTSILQELSLMLEEIWRTSQINRETMVVRRGNDSSTWNSMAGAWNKARDSWINLLYGMGLEAILEQVCFGKVLRLMAADVAAWHVHVGGTLDPNTLVWNELPLPWEVFSGRALCTKTMVVQACRKAGIDAEKSGWIAPRITGVVSFTPTPELVHGVSISNPFLAKVLRQHHYFSGKSNVQIINPEDN